MRQLALIIAALALAVPFDASAATLSSSFHVLANLTHQPGCTNFQTPDVNFGTLTGAVVGGQLTLPAAQQHMEITWNCDPTVNMTFEASAGNAGTESGSQTGRYMLNGASKLYYQLYLAAGFDCSNLFPQPWGDGTNGTWMPSPGSPGVPGKMDPGGVQDQGHVVCANLPQQSYPGDGSYSDTIVATIIF